MEENNCLMCLNPINDHLCLHYFLNHVRRCFKMRSKKSLNISPKENSGYSDTVQFEDSENEFESDDDIIEEKEIDFDDDE